MFYSKLYFLIHVIFFNNNMSKNLRPNVIWDTSHPYCKQILKITSKHDNY